MKTIKLLFLLWTGLLSVVNVHAQANASLNILTLNSGLVGQGGTVDIQVTVGNTGPASSIAANKVRAQISVPSALVSILPNAQQTGLPAGWTITVNTGSAITVCNGSDNIAVGTSRDIFIKVQGNSIGGPSTVNGNLLFSSGTSCTTPGTLSGDNTADNSSTSSIQVYDPIPATLTDFNAIVVNCQPLLTWKTEVEINTDRFEIERKNEINTDWTSIGIVQATGNTNTKSTYDFTDKDLNISSEHVQYRLKMIDKDGHYKYSEILTATVNCKKAIVNVYPNPVHHGKLYVDILNTTGFSVVTLNSLSGQVGMKRNMSNGNNNLNVSNIAQGIYILNITNSSGINKKIKIFVQN